MSYFGPARHFQQAADLLSAADRELRTPISFLCFHAIELALKAFLRAHNRSILGRTSRKHHRITSLYQECCELGLAISGDDQVNIASVVELLDSANEDQGLRYFREEASAIPTVTWTREVVEVLLASVEPYVHRRAEEDGVIAGRAIKLDFEVSKPEERRPS